MKETYNEAFWSVYFLTIHTKKQTLKWSDFLLVVVLVLESKGLSSNEAAIHRIHKWRTRGKKLVPSHESEALEDKQKLQMKTFSELAECLARIPPKITLYGRLFKYNYVERLLILMFTTALLFVIKRDAYIFKETGWFCKFPKPQKLDKWAMAGEKRRTCWPKLHTETEYESQFTAML